MNILITGNRGFIGSHLSSYLSDDFNIIGVDRKDGQEVMDIKELNSIDYVIHLAAQTSVWNNDYKKIFKDNVLAFVHILNLCKTYGVKFIYASSSCSINITSPYGISKMLNDMYAKHYGVGLRFHNVYGTNSRKDTLLGRCLNNDEILLYNNGENKRHFTYVDDVCKAVKIALTLPDGLYNVVNPTYNTTKEFVTEVQKYKDLKITLTDEVRKYDKKLQIVDTSLPNLVTTPTTIQNGIKQIFENKGILGTVKSKDDSLYLKTL